MNIIKQILFKIAAIWSRISLITNINPNIRLKPNFTHKPGLCQINYKHKCQNPVEAKWYPNLLHAWPNRAYKNRKSQKTEVKQHCELKKKNRNCVHVRQTFFLEGSLKISLRWGPIWILSFKVSTTKSSVLVEICIKQVKPWKDRYWLCSKST